MNPKSIVIISQDVVLTNFAISRFHHRFNVAVFNGITSALDYIYNTIPNLIIADLDMTGTTTVSILNNLKEDPLFNTLPVLAVLPDGASLSELEHVIVEDYIFKGQLEKEFIARVQLSMDRSERVVEINPLTRLPGNIAINRQMEDRLHNNAAFAIAYADLDYFKPFNDKYGFSRGDEVIKFTGRIILNIVKNSQPQGSFIGHIGGDDFIFMMDTEFIEKTAREIIDSFDRLIPTFYDDDDRQSGFITSIDRQGKTREFPMMGISIGITGTQCKAFSHYGELTEVASEMKKYAKEIKGSNYKMDLRRAPL
jgi:diguanylate cyclase (GGDEF)-like protein